MIVGYIPFTGSGSILVTSRDPAAKTGTFENSFGFDMEPLSQVEAAALLRRLTTRQGDALNQDQQHASLIIAKNVDGLSLAMTQMAGFIRKKQLTMREFVQLYNTDARYVQLREDAPPSQQYRYGLTLATTWSFQGLTSTARRHLEILSFQTWIAYRKTFSGIQTSKMIQHGSGTQIRLSMLVQSYSTLLSSSATCITKNSGSTV